MRHFPETEVQSLAAKLCREGWGGTYQMGQMGQMGQIGHTGQTVQIGT